MLSIWIFCFLIFSSRSAMILLPASSSCACFAARALSISNSSCSVMLFYSVLLIETAYHFSTFLSTVLRYLNPRKVLNFKAFQGFFTALSRKIRNSFFHSLSLPDDGLFSVRFPVPGGAITPAGKRFSLLHPVSWAMRTLRVKEIISKLNEILTGYFHYYGITDNSERITAFRYNVMKSYNWVKFLNMIDNSYPLVRARIYVSVYD